MAIWAAATLAAAAEAQVFVYPAPEGAPLVQEYQVTVQGKSVPVYLGFPTRFYGFCQFDLFGAVTVQVRTSLPLGNPRLIPQRTAFTVETLSPPLHLRWAVAFAEERIGTAVEPIVAGGRAFVGTHAGNLYALDSATGARWHFSAPGPLLHSPAVTEGRVITAAAGSGVYALDAATGRLLWTAAASAEGGGCAAVPLIANNRVFFDARATDASIAWTWPVLASCGGRTSPRPSANPLPGMASV